MTELTQNTERNKAHYRETNGDLDRPGTMMKLPGVNKSFHLRKF